MNVVIMCMSYNIVQTTAFEGSKVSSQSWNAVNVDCTAAEVDINAIPIRNISEMQKEVKYLKIS